MKSKQGRKEDGSPAFTLRPEAELTRFIQNFSADSVSPTTRAFYTEYRTGVCFHGQRPARQASPHGSNARQQLAGR